MSGYEPYLDLRENIEEAKRIFEDFISIVESVRVSWIWQKERQERTALVLSAMSFYRFPRGEYVFFNKKYLKRAVDIWKELAENHPEVEKWIRIYEERLESKEKLGDIGERIVDLSSSPNRIPVCFSMALEYEPAPYWGSIIADFRKLLSILARVKVGIFHLPVWWSTDEAWRQDEETGEIEWSDEVLDSDKPDQLIDDIRAEIEHNLLEHPYTVYLVILVHAKAENEVNIHGYLLWREATGEVNLQKLPTKTFRS